MRELKLSYYSPPFLTMRASVDAPHANVPKQPKVFSPQRGGRTASFIMPNEATHVTPGWCLSLNFGPLVIAPSATYYAPMAENPPAKTYVAALGYPTGMAFSPFESTTFQAPDDLEAQEKANEWANKNYHLVDAGTWLHVTVDGRGVYSKRMDKS